MMGAPLSDSRMKWYKWLLGVVSSESKMGFQLNYSLLDRSLQQIIEEQLQALSTEQYLDDHLAKQS